MDPQHHAVFENDDILETIRMLIREGITGVPVVNTSGEVVGILTELECLRLVAKGNEHGDYPHGPVKQFMKTDVQLVKPEMDIYYVAGLFLGTGYRRFAVVEGKKLVGVITRKDILRVVEMFLPEE